MINGYIENTSDRCRHIFKQSVTPGAKIKIKQLYEIYRKKYNDKLDINFVKWLEDNKVPQDWNIVVESYESEDNPVLDARKKEDVPEELVPPVKEDPRPITKTKSVHKLTALEISNLKHKDNPKSVIQRITSTHKLRRALTMCKGRKGKAVLAKYIRDQINRLK